MALDLMYITNKPDIAIIADQAGVNRIFIDLEVMDKEQRQPDMDTVKSHHKISDIKRIKTVLRNAEVLVRTNHIHPNYEKEINSILEGKPDIIMLPYFKTVDEIKMFLKIVNHRAKTSLLVETPEAVDCIDDIIKLSGIDEIHIGLNDLAIGYHKKFMFENLADGTVDVLCAKLRASGIKYGFGGIASLGHGLLPAERIIKEHYRLGSTCAILSRSFCNTEQVRDRKEIQKIFESGVKAIREYEKEVEFKWNYFGANMEEIRKIVTHVKGE